MSTLEFQQQLLSFRQQLYYFALSLTKDRENAADLVQESLVRALTYREKFQDNTNFKAWVYTIMKNTFINEHRRTRRKKLLMDTVDRQHDEARRVELPNSPEATVKMAEIQRSLERLDTTFREPFTMHHEGFKYHEIADKLGIPIGTVKSRIFQARHRLMDMLTDKNVAA
ncbi:MAG: RNA polymerase sigma factor [Flavobacteriales bacterium]|nr:RNA polymerase sigma factor [Flavobacteriales bacterium]